jgi:hypothetical protein
VTRVYGGSSGIYSVAGSTLLGGNLYQYHDNGRPAANGGTHIDGPGIDDYLEAVEKTELSPEQFGAVGDGSTDDQPQFQSMVDFLQTGEGGEIRCNAVEYALEDSITIKGGKPIAIFGAGGGIARGGGAGNNDTGTRFLVNFAGDGFVFGGDIGGGGGPRTRGHRLERFRINGIATAHSGIRMGAAGTDPFDDATSKISLKDLYIRGFDGPGISQVIHTTPTTTAAFTGACGIFIARALTSRWENVTIEFCHNAIGESSWGRTTTINFDNCSFRQNTNWAVKINTGVSVHFEDCLFESNTMGAVLARPLSGQNGSISGLTFSDCHTEGNMSVVGDSDAGYAVLDNGGVFTDYTDEWNDATTNDVDLLPASPADNDALYVGHEDAEHKSLFFIIGTAGAGSWTLEKEYWNGAAWVTHTNITDNTSDFTLSGGRSVEFDLPPDGAWKRSSVNGRMAFWTRFRVTSFVSITTQPLATSGIIAADLFDFMFDDEDGGQVKNVRFIGGQIGAAGANHGCVSFRNSRDSHIKYTTLQSVDAGFPYVRSRLTDVEGITVETEVPTPYADRLDLDEHTNFLQNFNGNHTARLRSFLDLDYSASGGVKGNLVNDGRQLALPDGDTTDEQLKAITLPAFIDRHSSLKITIIGLFASNGNTKEVWAKYGGVAGTDVYRHSTTNSGELFKVELYCRFNASGTAFLVNGFDNVAGTSSPVRNTAVSTGYDEKAELSIGGVGSSASDVIIYEVEFSMLLEGGDINATLP